MAVHWQIHFKSLQEADFYVDIYDNTYTGSTVIPLTGAPMAFVTNEDTDENMYMPIRTQSGYIRFYVESATIVNELRPAQCTDRPVVFRHNTTVLWMGFLKPEQYSQPWAPMPYEIEIPVMSVMEAMQGVMFTQSEGYTSLFDLIRTINSYCPKNIYITAPAETPVKDVYVQNNNFRKFLTIPERTERSTTNIYESISIYECVEHFCQYFGISLHEYENTFFFVVYPDTDINYVDIDPSGNSQASQWTSHTLDSLTICGNDNKQSYSKVYRRIKGEFDTSSEKAEDVYSISDFFKHFSVEGAYTQTVPTNLLFYGNAEVQPYKNGIQKTEWISEISSDSGGQIIRKRDVAWNTADQEGSSWTDAFFVYSQKAKAGSPESAIVFNIPTYVYLQDNEYAALSINFAVAAWYNATQSGDFIKRVHCKLRVGNYWLKSDYPSGSTHTRYSWTTTESTCWMVIDNGQVTMKDTIYTLDYVAERTLDSVNGFAIDMPSGLSAGYYSVYFELLANAEATADFDIYTSIGYLISGISISVMRGTNDVSLPTPDYDQNNIIRLLSGLYQDDYMIGCIITSKRGTQYGSGMALNASHGYVTTKYDEIGVERRASILNKSREILTVKVRDWVQPIDSVTNGVRNYGILSQSVDWWNGETDIQIINLD